MIPNISQVPKNQFLKRKIDGGNGREKTDHKLPSSPHRSLECTRHMIRFFGDKIKEQTFHFQNSAIRYVFPLFRFAFCNPRFEFLICWDNDDSSSHEAFKPAHFAPLCSRIYICLVDNKQIRLTMCVCVCLNIY